MTQVNSLIESVDFIEQFHGNLLLWFDEIEKNDVNANINNLMREYLLWEQRFINHCIAIDGRVTLKHKNFLNKLYEDSDSVEEIKYDIITTINNHSGILKVIPDFFHVIIDYEIENQYPQANLLVSYIFALGNIIGSLAGEQSSKFEDTLFDFIGMLDTELEELGLISFRGKINAERSTSAPVKKTEENTTVNLETLLDKLSKLTGLQRVKEDVFSLINMVRIREMRIKQNLPVPAMSLHLVFTGNPGTGKTTVARLLAEIYARIGLLSKGQLIEVDRSQLVAGYVGQTAIKVSEVVERAKGGILFIDEAYTLTSTQHGNDYGNEAVDTLIKLMEDHRDDLIVIVAGYSEKMNDFINSNPGVKSRFNKYIHFDDYNSSEMLEIFKSMCSESAYTLSSSAIEYLDEYFTKLQRNSDFGNARDVRNLFEKTISNQANRLMSLLNPDEINLTNIEYSDVAGQ